MSQTSPDAKAVVRAAEALTTQVRRIADALSTPVVRVGDGMPTTCEASTLGPFDRHLGPCMLRREHDGPVHRGPDGETWATVVQAADDGPTTPATTCSAQYHAHESGPRLCIRAAHHPGVHINDRGFQWPDDVAVYPTDSTVKVGPPLPRPAEEIEDERAVREQRAADLYRQGLLSDSELNAVFATPADEDAQRATRRESLLNLLARLQRGGMTAEEKVALRQHIETEMREADTARAVAAGNLRHVKTLVPELEQAQAAIERVRAMATTQRARGESGSTDHKIGLYDAAVAILAALDGTEQPATEGP